MKQATLVRNYWIGVVSKTHVDKAVAGGHTQLNHGKAGPLERMREGDGFAFSSPRIDHPYGAPLQAFTAIGRAAARSFKPTRATALSPSAARSTICLRMKRRSSR